MSLKVWRADGGYREVDGALVWIPRRRQLLLTRTYLATAVRQSPQRAHQDHKTGTRAVPSLVARRNGSAQHAVQFFRTLHPHPHVRNREACFRTRMGWTFQ